MTEHGITTTSADLWAHICPKARKVYLYLVRDMRLCRTYLEQRVRRYSEIDPKHLAALGGDTFPRPPLYEVAS